MVSGGFPGMLRWFLLRWRCCGHSGVVAALALSAENIWRSELWSSDAKERRLWQWCRRLEEGCGRENGGDDVVDWCLVLFVDYFFFIFFVLKFACHYWVLSEQVGCSQFPSGREGDRDKVKLGKTKENEKEKDKNIQWFV